MSGLVSEFHTVVSATLKHAIFVTAKSVTGLNEVVNLDDAAIAEKALRNRHNALVYESPSLRQDPRDPMWTIQFSVGAKTVDDSYGLELGRLVAELSDVFGENQTIELFNWDDETVDGRPSQKQGEMYVVDVEMDDGVVEPSATLRVLRVTARAIRNAA